MENLKALGTDIGQTALPTFKTYLPLLAARASSFLQPREYRYGKWERQVFDLYIPPKADESPEDDKKFPVMIFIHGGGLDRGDKRLPMARGGAHQNIGDFFARRGFITIVMNYRLRLPHDHPLFSTLNNALFPSGGEDVQELLAYLSAQLSAAEPEDNAFINIDRGRIFLLGNSAGAIHISTYLFRDAIPSFPSSSSTLKARAAILLSPPASFEQANPERATTLYGYFDALQDSAGNRLEESESKRILGEKCPLGLRKKSKDKTEVSVGWAELEPEGEILEPVKQFLAAYPEKPHSFFVHGHNHISPPLGIGLGGKEEQWGQDIVAWAISRQ